jgi:hypothetical protein
MKITPIVLIAGQKFSRYIEVYLNVQRFPDIIIQALTHPPPQPPQLTTSMQIILRIHNSAIFDHT